MWPQWEEAHLQGPEVILNFTKRSKNLHIYKCQSRYGPAHHWPIIV